MDSIRASGHTHAAMAHLLVAKKQAPCCYRIYLLSRLFTPFPVRVSHPFPWRLYVAETFVLYVLPRHLTRVSL